MSELLRKANLNSRLKKSYFIHASTNFDLYQATCYLDGNAMGKLYQADHNLTDQDDDCPFQIIRWSSGPVDLSGSEEGDSDDEAFEGDSDGDY